MVVNALVTGLIVFKIFKVFLEVKPTLTERALGSSTGGTKLLDIIFIIIESGMALLAIQLFRAVISGLIELQATPTSPQIIALTFAIYFHQMLNVIIKICSFVLLVTFSLLGHCTNNNFGAGFNVSEIVLRKRGIFQGSCGKFEF